MFPLPFSPDHLEALEKIQHAALVGGSFAVSSPRGDGKTQRSIAGLLWACLNGHSRFALALAATENLAKRLLREIVQQLADNDELARDWPEFCLPIREAFGKPNRAGYLTVNGEPVRLELTTTKLVFPTWSKAPQQFGGTIIAGAGILAAVRGMRHTTANGETLRPDFCLIDDPQTRRSANSTHQCAHRLAILQGDIKRLAGPDKEVRCVAGITVIRKGDAADQLLDNQKHPEWRGVRKAMVYRWPDAKELWKTYQELRRNGLLDGDGGKAANEFYLANREAMDKGGVAGWEHRFRPDLGEVSAIQCAFNILTDDGERAFFSECQNAPLEETAIVIRLTADNVMQRTNGLPLGEVPEETQIVTGFIDVNDHALAWAMGAWHYKANAVIGAIIGYGEWGRSGNGRIGDVQRADKIWDEAKPSPEGKAVAFWNALNGLASWLFTAGRWTRKGQAVQPNLVLIDSGYTLTKGDTTVYRWIANYIRGGGGNVGYSRGWPARTFRIEKTSEGSNSEVLKASRESWWRFERYKPLENVFGLPHDAEFHDRVMQCGWLLPAGAPGSLTVNGTKPEEHLVFAQQIAGLKLIEFKNSDAAGISGLYVWTRTPGVRNEMSDCVRGARLAALYRLGDAGNAPQPAAQPAPSATSNPQQPAATPKPAQPPQKFQPVLAPDTTGWDSW